MAKSKKQWSNPFYTMYHFQNLNDFEAENESVQSFMDLVLSKGYSMRVQAIHKTVFYAEIVKDFETHSFAMIDGKGQLHKAKSIKGRNITIDDYIRDGKWEKLTESQYFEEE